MKKIAIIPIVLFSFGLNAQEQEAKKCAGHQRRMMGNHKNAAHNQKFHAENFKKMSYEERLEAMKNMEMKSIALQLNLNEENTKKFDALYPEYLDSQMRINNAYRAKYNQDLTDTEARKCLEDSFKNAQELLDNRKKYSKKFLEFLTPQQVLKVFNNQNRLMHKVTSEKLERNP